MTGSHVVEKTSLSSAGAMAAVAAAVEAATAIGVPVTIVVLDESGNVKALVRMDGAPLVSIQTATSKAYAAVAIGMPPDDFYQAIKDDGAAVASFATRPGLALIAGGLPVVVNGVTVGSIGVAGAMTGAGDRHIAEVAAQSVVG